MDGVMHPSVEQAIGRDRVRNALKRYENRPADEHRYGIVRSVNSDGSYEVLLDGDAQTARCAQFDTALVGDRVIVVVKKDGTNDLLGRLGGEAVTPEADARFEAVEAGLDAAVNRIDVLETAKAYDIGDATLTRVGKVCVVCVHGLMLTVESFGEVNVGTLPDGCAPIARTSGALTCSLGSSSAAMVAYENGTVSVITGSDGIDGEFCYGQVVFLCK